MNTRVASLKHSIVPTSRFVSRLLSSNSCNMNAMQRVCNTRHWSEVSGNIMREDYTQRPWKSCDACNKNCRIHGKCFRRPPILAMPLRHGRQCRLLLASTLPPTKWRNNAMRGCSPMKRRAHSASMSAVRSYLLIATLRASRCDHCRRRRVPRPRARRRTAADA